MEVSVSALPATVSVALQTSHSFLCLVQRLTLTAKVRFPHCPVSYAHTTRGEDVIG